MVTCRLGTFKWVIIQSNEVVLGDIDITRLIFMKKKVLITGANSGIGLHLALSLLENNYHVAVLDVEINEISKWKEKYEIGLLIYRCDITSQEMVTETVKEILNIWDKIDIVVNNACKAFFGPFMETEMIEIESVFRVNVMGMLHIIKAVLPDMIKRNEGLIHNVGSGVGITGFGNLLGYSASKGAVETLTKCLRLEYSGTNIVFNIIHPPLTITPSSNPIGFPREMMEDPEKVGRAISQQIESTGRIITTGLKDFIGIRIMKLFPYFMGKMFSKFTIRNQIKHRS